MKVQITVDVEELAQSVPLAKVIQAYGKNEVLGQFMVNEITQYFDADSLLEAIGEERIKDFLSYSSKEIA